MINHLSLIINTIIVIVALCFISGTEINGFRIKIHNWWIGLGVMLISIGIGLIIIKEKEKSYKRGLEKGKQVTIEILQDDIKKDNK